jgi:hypothetical protein
MHSLRRVRRIVAVFLATPVIVSLFGCGLLDPEICHAGIFYEVEPPAATIAVGESFTVVATIDSCPEGKRPLVLAWRAEDPSIVEVDSETGRVTGLGAGQTAVHGAGMDGVELLTVLVTVLGPV